MAEESEKNVYEKFIETANEEDMNFLFVSLISADTLMSKEDCDRNMKTLNAICDALKTCDISKERRDKWLKFCEDGKEIIIRDTEFFTNSEKQDS